MRPSASTAARLLVVLLFVLSADMGEAKKKCGPNPSPALP